MWSRASIVTISLALMLGGLVLDILTPQQFIAAIVWIVPIALSGLAFSKRFTYGLVIAAVILSGLVSWLNADVQGGLDGIAVLNRVLLAACAIMVGVMTVNLSDFSQRVGQLQEREEKIRQERDLERVAATVASSQNLTEALEQVVPVLAQMLGRGAMMVGVNDNRLVEPRVAENVLPEVWPVGAALPNNPEQQIALPNQRPALMARVQQPPLLIAILEPAINAEANLQRLLPVLGRALERVVLLDDLSMQRTLLERRNTIIRDLIYAFSHDLRTPLMANGMNMKLALEGAFGVLPDFYLRSLENGLAANQDLLELAEKLLLVARYEGGETSPQLETVDLRRALLEMTARLEPVARERKVHFELQLERLEVRGNSPELRRVLQNLLDNAIKFCPPMQTIQVRLQRQQSNIRIEVRDPGPGVTHELETRLFTRFSSARAGGGSGLGLYLARRIIEAHGGRIGYARDNDAKVAQTIFWVELPELERRPS
jgi:two-component system, OmpR family, sensor histidine kinase KdpD